MLPTTDAKHDPLAAWFAPRQSLGGAAPIDHLFNQLDGLYPQRWRSAFANQQAIENWRHAWAEAIVEEGLTRDDIRAGLAACRRRFDWPPSFAEFLKACRPPIDYEASFIEAAEQLHRRDTDTDRWSSPVVFWAASRMASEVRSLSWQQAAGRWRKEIDKAAAEIKAGTLPNEVPKRLTALPPPGETTPCPEDVRRRLNEMMARLKGNAA